MKKLISLISVLALTVLTLSSCSAGGWAAEVNSVRLDKEIFTYYIDSVLSENPEDKSPGAVTAAALEECEKYVAVNSMFAEMKMSLSDDEKGAVSAEVNNLWQLYGRYYEKIGVSRQTLVKVKESEAFKNAIFMGIYNTGGTAPIAEETIKKYWQENYVIFKAISDYLTDVSEEGETVTMNEESRKTLTATFDNLTERINAGEGIDAVYSSYTQQEGSIVEASVINKASQNYPEGFFAAVSAIEADKAKTVVLGDYIFSVQRMASDSDGDMYYQLYRENCLKALGQDDFKKVMEKQYSAFSGVLNERAAEKCYNKVAEASSLFAEAESDS